MSSAGPRPVDLTQVPAVPWAWVDEHVYAAIRGCSVKVLQHERRLNMGCPFRRINGATIRYKFGDITAFLESQPGGGGAAKPGSQPAREGGASHGLITGGFDQEQYVPPVRGFGKDREDRAGRSGRTRHYACS